MKNFTGEEVIWLLGAVLGGASIIAAMYLDDKNLFRASDYKAVLPSIAFIAASTSLVAVAEAFDLSMRLNRSDLSDGEIAARNKLVSANVILSLTFVVLFAKDVSKSSKIDYVVDLYDLFIAIFSVILSVFVTLKLKRSMRRDV